MDPELCYLSWTLTLRTEHDEGRILDVFAFVEEHCRIGIDCLEDVLPEVAQPEGDAAQSPSPAAAAAPAGQPSALDKAGSRATCRAALHLQRTRGHCQDRQADQVTSAVTQMDQVTQANAAQTEEMSSTASAPTARPPRGRGRRRAQGLPGVLRRAMPQLAISDAEFSAISELVRAKIGIHLSSHKRNLVVARLASRLRTLGHDSFARYYEYLSQHDPEGQELRFMLNRITTNKTSFFRERHHFDFVRDRLIPELLQHGKHKLRAWSAACSTGQEPYSLAMLLGADQRLRGWDVRILASDVDTEVLADAQAAEYSAAEVAEVPAELRACSLDRQGNTFTIRRELRELVTFRHINLMQEPWPIHVHFDVIMR
jgi:chemotaxis protein methyltransferase CheR